MNIAACKGCFACWQKTPGICCIKDDMQTVIEKLIDADLILWSFPLYYFNVPGILKNLIDRQLPMSLPLHAAIFIEATWSSSMERLSSSFVHPFLNPSMKLYASFNELLLLPLGLPLIRSIFMLSSLHIHT